MRLVARRTHQTTGRKTMDLANLDATKATLRRFQKVSDSQKVADPKDREEAADELARSMNAAYLQDRGFYRIVAAGLGIAVIVVICMITYLIHHDHQHFDALTSIGSTAIGGLVGLFLRA